jgi:DNA-binding HxlR family transcriptional regulator
MNRKSKSCASEGVNICLCPLEGIMETLSRRWALAIVGALGNRQKLRYNEIMKRLGNISPKSLSDRLKELEKAGLIEREAYPEIPPRVEYSLTPEGEDLKKAIVPLIEWVNKRNESD